MPVKRGVGFNPYSTPNKQAALDGLAGHLLGSVAAIARKYGTNAVVLDMTCGPGSDGTGKPGSPLILAKHVQRLLEMGLSCNLVCVDRVHAHLETLQATIHPDLPVRYETSQRVALESLPRNTVGLAYFDPTRYTDLDIDLLRDMGRWFARLDILFTRECLAYYRMKCAAHTRDMALGIEDYLAATGKRCRYVVQYAAYNWWAFGFADNWATRPAEKMRWQAGKLLNVDTPEGRALCDRLMKKEREQRWDQPPLPGMEEA